jgi:uncharacterized protein with HEPN domain
VTRRDRERLTDVLEALDAIRNHLARGDLSDGLVLDAVRLRLIEIGEAVKGLTPVLTGTEPDIPWDDIAGMRDWLAHHYVDTSHAIVQATVEEDLPKLEAAVRRLEQRDDPGGR